MKTTYHVCDCEAEGEVLGDGVHEAQEVHHAGLIGISNMTVIKVLLDSKDCLAVLW